LSIVRRVVYLEKIELKTPIGEGDARRLRVGDVIYVSGTLVTARDAAHKRIIQYLKVGRKLPFTFNGLPLYHCGPLVKKTDNEWTVLAAGPTTSMRMEPFEDVIIRRLGVHLVIGKGGMGEKTGKAMKESGAVYGAFTGGAAVLASKQIKKVKSVQWLGLGMLEAVWSFEVDNFGPLIVCMDSYGNNLYAKVKADAENVKAKIVSSFKP
jgi:fumarate hydratase subunit beta